MDLAGVRDLKQLLTQSVLASLTQTREPGRSLAVPAGPLAIARRVQPSLALGIVRRGPGDFRLAVRYQRRELERSRELEQIRKQCRGEADVRFIGSLTKLARAATTPWRQRRHRPLRLGTSLGHYQVTAGTLGAAVRRRADGASLLLSNNHVLANENKAKLGDAILQPGAFDRGVRPDDVAAELSRVARLKKTRPNLVDAAVAAPVRGIEVETRMIRGLGKLAGLGPEILEEDREVAKLGRTTGLTRGRVTAFELDNVVVAYGLGMLRFDNQIEIEGTGAAPFSEGGDSGSLVVDEERHAVGLLFAGGEIGGSNGQGLSYSNPIRPVLDLLAVDLET